MKTKTKALKSKQQVSSLGYISTLGENQIKSSSSTWYTNIGIYLLQEIFD